jgi:hypothetical protein
VRRGWRGSNPRRPAPMEQGMPALTSHIVSLSAAHCRTTATKARRSGAAVVALLPLSEPGVAAAGGAGGAGPLPDSDGACA